MRKIEGPRDLPYLRDQLAALETRNVNDEIALQPEQDPDHERWYQGVREAEKVIQTASMYWVTREMTRLAFDSSHDLPEWTPAAARPESSGLLVWGEALPEIVNETMRIMWRRSGYDQDPLYRPFGFMWWTDPDSSSEASLCVSILGAGPHFPVGERFSLPLHQPADMTGARGPLLALIGTTWIMMQEPKLAERRVINPGKKDTARALRAGGSRPLITTISLRSLRSVHDREKGTDSGRRLGVRHIVRGHWRQQYHRSDGSHRPKFIPPHIRGDPSLPLQATEHVMVWRR